MASALAMDWGWRATGSTRGRVLMIKTPHTRNASPHSTLEYNIDRWTEDEELPALPVGAC